jgi:hypothetical protein
MVFGTKTNGETEGFIMGMRLTGAGQMSVSLKVSIQLLDFWGLMIKIILILGGCFLLTMSLAIAYVIYKWRRRQLFYALMNQNRDITHLDTYMPKVQLGRDVTSGEELCSVCLVEMEESWVRKTVCGHVFHQDCLDEWCKTNLSCPICRRSFELAELKTDGRSFDGINASINGSGLRDGILE